MESGTPHGAVARLRYQPRPPAGPAGSDYGKSRPDRSRGDAHFAVDATSLPALERPDNLNLGARACLLSHCKALRAFLATASPAALILEDDAEVASDTAALLESTDWWPPGASVLKLESTGRKPRFVGAHRGRTPTGRSLRRMYHGSGGAAGYLIDRTAARTVLDSCEETPMQIDRILFGQHRSRTARRLRPLQIVPAMVRQRRGSSDPSDNVPWKQKAQQEGLLSDRQWHRLGAMFHNLTVVALRAGGRVQRVPIPFEP
ncbi:MAG: hypothetical protein F4204_00230 [Rhodospirillaceae bacterium]|nr:hypothetical protein [Rhodospirillaceae bacterium]